MRSGNQWRSILLLAVGVLVLVGTGVGKRELMGYALAGAAVGIIGAASVAVVRNASPRALLVATGLAILLSVMGSLYWLSRPDEDECPVGTVAKAKYNGSMDYRPATREWLLDAEITIYEVYESICLEPQVSLIPEYSTQIIARGWRQVAIVDGKPVFTKRVRYPSIEKWYFLNTTNEIALDELGMFSLVEGSQLVIIAPENLVGNTWPPSRSRSPMPGGRKERLLVPLSFVQERPAFLFDLYNPLLRSSFVSAVREFVSWSPIKWVVFAVLALFGEQIKKSLLVPLVRRILRVLSLPYRTDSAR